MSKAGEPMQRATVAFSSRELILGRYRPIKPLGGGSSGSVWFALDERTGLDVALKIVPREGKTGARAEREAGAAAKLRHPRCQRIYDQASDGSHVYIAYEYVAGATMREATRQGKLTDAGAIEAAAQILEGLAHAHGKGIVHRDVKPANVLLEDGPEISIRLLDFGLARFAEAETLTAVGDVPGTLAYISPERLSGEAASPASDVWSVGVMLWEALAGRHPFWAPSLLATSKKIEAGAPSLARPRPDLPKPLVAAVARALHLDPMQRPSAADLAKTLRQARRTRPSAKAPSPRAATPPPLARVLPALLAALFAGWAGSALSFYPTGWPAALALIAGVLTFFSARGGLAFALVVPIFPLGNTGLGLALLYAFAAALWFVLHLREPRAAFAFALGPLLAPLSLLGFLPLTLQPVRSAWRRALHAGTGVLTAALVAGLTGAGLPFSSGHIGSLGLEEERSPVQAFTVLRHVIGAHPALLLEALALGVAAAVLPLARRKGIWGIAVYGAVVITATVIAAPHANPVAAVLTTWATCIALALWQTRTQWLPRVRPLVPRPQTLD
jgi:eukaryotic-like serine/threonine-protein kinase